jgi:ribosome biogenesis GTPase
LREAISGYRVLLAGQSGMGKSRLLNALVPDAAAAIGELSVALSSGRHTTTAARLFALPPLENGDSGGEVIDTPGFQAFGLAHLSRTEIERGFPEFEAFTNACRYYDCRHVNEPGCGVRQGVVDGLIDATRHALYCRVANSP